MAFVYSQPRWSPPKNSQTPGPGSHFTHLPKPTPKNGSNFSTNIRKGKAFIRNQSQINNQKTLPPEQSHHHGMMCNIELGATPNKSQKKITSRTKCSKAKQKILMRHQNQPISTSIMQIKSLQGGKVYDGNSYESKRVQTKQQVYQRQWVSLQNLMVQKTKPSIKQIYPQKFYIGSKQQYLKKHVKNTNPHPGHQSGKKFTKKKSKFCEGFQKGENYSLSKSVSSQQYSQYESREKVTKPVSAQHPFRRKQQFNNLQSSKYQEKSTGIQEEDNTQFLPDAVPGPGTYEIGGQTKTTKKGMMFTQKNKNRFRDVFNQKKVSYEFIYDCKPSTSKSKSRAKQNKVAFGRALFGFNQNQQNKGQCLTDFYQNFTNIQSKSTKTKLKDALNPGFFTSKVPRFTYQNFTNQNIDSCKDQGSESKIKKLTNSNKIVHPFSSGVQKYTQNSTITANIDFNGQNFKTIQHDLQTLMAQPKYYESVKLPHKQVEDEQSIHLIESQKRIKSDIEIKNQLIQDLYGYRQRDKKTKRRQEIKGYTFNSKQNFTREIQGTPSPTDYYKEKDWTKNTFNLKFIPQQDQKTQKKDQGPKTKPNLAKQRHQIQQINLLRI